MIVLRLYWCRSITNKLLSISEWRFLKKSDGYSKNLIDEDRIQTKMNSIFQQRTKKKQEFFERTDSLSVTVCRQFLSQACDRYINHMNLSCLMIYI